MIFYLTYQSPQGEASFHVGSGHFCEYPFDDFESSLSPPPLDARIVERVFRPSGRPGKESSRMRGMERHI
jgi:hypothetical protein